MTLNTTDGRHHGASARTDANPITSHKLAEVLGLLDAIEAGGLLATPPEDTDLRIRHETGLALLAVARERLKALIATQNLAS